MQEENTTEEVEIRDPRVYEVGYLLVPQITTENLDAEVDVVRKIVTDQGGLPISEGPAALMELEYPMQKVVQNERQTYTKGYFGWIKFDISPESVEKIKKALDANDSVFRFLITNTVRENTLIGAKLNGGGKFVREEKAPKAINEAELDKQIDELVVPE